MNINFKATNYELTEEVTGSAQKKIRITQKYLDESAGQTQVFVELGKETRAHHNGKIWLAKIILVSAGSQFEADALEETMENAVDKAVAELSRELSRAKKRKHSLVRRGGAAVKGFLRGFRN